MFEPAPPRPEPAVPGDPPPRLALDGLRFAVAGPGRVGRSLARWAVDCGALQELTVCRSPRGADELSFDQAAALGGKPNDRFQPLDLLLLTVSDDALAPTARRWATALARSRRPADRPAPFAVVLHSAGGFDAEVLAPLRRAGIAVGSLHPLRAFTEVAETPGPRPYFAIDGDTAAVFLARRLVAAWDGVGCELAGDRRLAYHLAASLAAGGVVTVLAAVAQLMHDAELPDALLEGYLRLLRGAVDLAGATGRPGDVASAITGPAARDDRATLERHLATLRATSPELEPVVGALWQETRRLMAATEPAIEPAIGAHSALSILVDRS